MAPLLSFSLLLLLLLLLLRTSSSHQTPISTPPPQPTFPNKCNDQCGSLHIPFPFHLTNSCSLPFPAFRLSCLHPDALYLTLGSTKYRVLDFSYDALLIDSTTSVPCPRYYFGLDSFTFDGGQFYGISVENIVRLYDCEDSSVCKEECEGVEVEGCDGKGSIGCCYPLSDPSFWRVGDRFSEFLEFGCRGFSSWVVMGGGKLAKRGIKIEWAIPRDSSDGVCASNAVLVNATAVRGGIRCVCESSFVGDGFAEGVGCLKSCIKDGHTAYGKDCFTGGHSKKKVMILSGILVSISFVATAVASYALLRQPVNANKWETDPDHLPSILEFRKACRTQLFTYRELEEATKGFDEGQKLFDGSVHSGVLHDGSLVAVQKIQCENEQDLMQILTKIEFLSAISHKNVSRLIGCCIDLGYMPLVVYDLFENPTLEESLKGVEWYYRIKMASETANALAYMQTEISPPIYHRNLKSSYILIDRDYSVKIFGFWVSRFNIEDQYSNSPDNDIYNFGVILLEIITGSSHIDLPVVAFRKKISEGKLDEIVDPILCFQEHPFQREQIERTAILAARCLLYSEDSRLISMTQVARELEGIMKESVDRGRRRGAALALEETFSNSSLLQMISMSPDSINVPAPGMGGGDR